MSLDVRLAWNWRTGGKEELAFGKFEQSIEQYGNQNNGKNSKIEKIVKHALFIVPFLLNNLSMSELSDLEEADEHFVKSKCGPFKTLDFRLMIFIKHLKEISSEF